MANPSNIPIFTTPQPAASMLDTLNNLINQINSAVQANASAENSPALPAVASRFYGLPKGTTPGTLLAVTATMYAYPIFIPGNVPIASISLYSSTGQTGGAGHAGIYNDVNGAPGTLVTGSDSGALTLTANTTVATASYASALVLQKGWYWLASIFTASSTFPTVGALAAGYASELSSNLGFDTAAHAFAASGEAVMGVTATGTYGALPATFPTTAYALTLNAATPMVVLGT